jgi:hypothetical protein
MPAAGAPVKAAARYPLSVTCRAPQMSQETVRAYFLFLLLLPDFLLNDRGDIGYNPFQLLGIGALAHDAD